MGRAPTTASRQHDVVICGAGPTGLTLSILLSRFGIRHLVIERKETEGGVPRARGINHRTGEIWQLLGLGDALRSATLPPEWLERMVYQETLAGPLVGTVETPGDRPGASSHLTPSDSYCISQDRTDVLLARHAATYEEASIRFGTEFAGVRRRPDAVDVTVRTGAGEEHIRAAWLIGCDGTASDVRAAADIPRVQLATLDSFVNAHFVADLGRWTENRKAVLLWNMQEGAEGVFGPLDGGSYWRCQINFDPAQDAPDSWTAEKVMARIRTMIGAADADMPPIELRSFYPYEVRAALASHFMSGRILLAGDAAHQIPPHGALGMNTGVQTAHNLAWKLAAVIRGDASARLLESYETERREVAERVIGHAISNYERVVRIRRKGTPEQRRDNVRGARGYGNAFGLDIGVHYSRGGAFVAEEQAGPCAEEDITMYVPTAAPGWRAPHFWVRREAGRISSIALSDGCFALLAGRDGDAWVAAARDLGGGPAVHAVTVGPEGDIVPEEQVFEDLYGIEHSGCVLIRPDGHVAFRSRTCPADPRAELAHVFEAIGFAQSFVKI